MPELEPMGSRDPEISVVVIAADRYGRIEKTMAHLRQQTIRTAIELIIVALEPDVIEVIREDRSAFHSLRVIVCAGGDLLSTAPAAGIRHASAPVVAMVEDHCYPEPEWAGALLARHRAGYAVVGAQIGNANPGSAIARCAFVTSFCAYAPPAPSGETESVATHNSSYHRDLLLALGPELETLFASETILQWRLREQGHRIYLEPRARAVHVNTSQLSALLWNRFLGARIFSGTRSRGWNFARRIREAAIAPAAEIKRLAGRVREKQRRGVAGTYASLLPLLPLCWLASCTGYFAGYLTGVGSLVHAGRFFFDQKKRVSVAERRQRLLAD